MLSKSGLGSTLRDPIVLSDDSYDDEDKGQDVSVSNRYSNSHVSGGSSAAKSESFAKTPVQMPPARHSHAATTLHTERLKSQPVSHEPIPREEVQSLITSKSLPVSGKHIPRKELQSPIASKSQPVSGKPNPRHEPQSPVMTGNEQLKTAPTVDGPSAGETKPSKTGTIVGGESQDDEVVVVGRKKVIMAALERNKASFQASGNGIEKLLEYDVVFGTFWLRTPIAVLLT